VLLEEREGIVTAKRETQKCKDKLNTRAERFFPAQPFVFLHLLFSTGRYSLTLTLTHDAIHALNEEASYLKNQFQYISTQVTSRRLSLVLHTTPLAHVTISNKNLPSF
jgi:hypothetical protein